MTEPCGLSADNIWKPSENLPERIKKLRDEYYSFYERDYFRNEVRGYSTGMPWDIVFSSHQWGVVPEMYQLFAAFEDSLAASAEPVDLDEGFWKEPLIIRRGTFFKNVIEGHLPVKILDDELIVGSYFNTALSKCLTQSETRVWKKLEKKWLKSASHVNFNGIGNAGAVPGHLIPNYPKVLEFGFEGLKEQYESMLEESPDQAKKDFLRALVICCKAAGKFASRYADEASRLMAITKDMKRKQELESINSTCKQVPWKPATTFREALQSLWFTHMLVMTAESYPGPGLSPGRIDQYLYPFYKNDLEAGVMTRKEAKELLQCFWIKTNYAYDFQGRVGTNQGINSGFGQLITLSGKGPRGEDLTNDLTWLILEVIEEMNMLEPKPNIRVHKNTPDELFTRICEIVSKAQGSPFLINFDENSIRGLEWEGLPKDKLWNYAPVGCLENTLQGCERAGTVDVNVNIPKVIELVLFNGRDINDKKLGKKTGNPTRFSNFKEFYQAVKTQLIYLLDEMIHSANIADEIRARFEPTPYLSVLIDGCAENGKDITAGGAQYNFITVEGIGLATCIDSLAAIRELVYTSKLIEISELIQAIKDNFEGHEKLRQLLINKAPKFGNDIQEVDELGRDLSQFWNEYVFQKKSPSTGRQYRAGYLSWNYWITYADSTAATPDGRRKGMFLSNALCPVNGVDKKGPTSIIKSVGNLGIHTAPNGGSHTLALNPSILKDPEHLDKLKALIKGYNEVGGTCLQLNIVDAGTLRKAQQHPDEYKNLLVRVTGYNAYFTQIGKAIQEEIIARFSHQL
ncbi:MAG: pyruvate formate lyase family protein [Candidatus Hodarchaeota archaeon]